MNRNIIIIFLSTISFLISYLSPNNVPNSDPEGTLLTSQAIIEYGSIKLDPYYDEINFDQYKFTQINNHYYYLYPIGTPILSIPFVSLALLLDYDMVIYEDQAELQNLLSAICVSITSILIYMISSKYLNKFYSLIPTLSFTFGSSLISTNATALWSSCFLIIIYLSIILLIFPEINKKNYLINVLIGFLLFIAFLVKPTSSVFILITLIYIFLEDRISFLVTSLISFLLLSFFVLFSLNEFSSILPPYYIQFNSLIPSNIFTGLFGLLFSPSRGLFIYSPFLILFIIGFIYYRGEIISKKIFIFGLVWFVLYTIMISTWENWWGGHSYGSRLMIDIIPAWLLMSIYVFREAIKSPFTPLKKSLILFFSIFGIISVILNSYIGLYNPMTQHWNVIADVNNTQDYLVSWRYPQFAASEKLFQDLQYERQQNELRERIETIKPYRIGKSIYPNEGLALYLGWHEPENSGEYRWSAQRESLIYLRFDDDTLKGHQSIDLMIQPGIAFTKTVNIFVNDYHIVQLEGEENIEIPTLFLPVNKSILKTGLVEIKFLTPDETPINKLFPNSNDFRNIGIRLFKLKFVEQTKEPS